MKERQEKIINTLLFSVSPVKISNLQEDIGVSERTIKYDIAEIRKEFIKNGWRLLNKKGVGYYITPEDKRILIKKYSLKSESDLNNDDFLNILMYLLLVENPASIRDIADKLFLNELTIKKYIKQEMSDVQKQNIIKFNTGSVISLVGNERNIRQFFLNLSFSQMEKMNKNEVALKMQRSFPFFKEDITIESYLRIERIFRKVVKKWNVWISEEAYIRLVLHLFIVYLRKDYKLNYLDSEVTLFKKLKNEYNFSKVLLDELFWGIIDPQEVLNLVEVMANNNVFIDDDIEWSNEERLKDVVERMIDYITNHYPAYTVNKDDFIEDIIPHLRHTLREHQLGVVEYTNPLFYQIKRNYQEYFSIAKELCILFCDEFQLSFSENKVSYLTIYLYKNISLKVKRPYYVYVVCGTGRGFSKLIQTRISNKFENIEIIDTLSSFRLLQQKELSKADFIISTISLPETDIPVVKISSFLGTEDIDKIQRVLDYGTQFSILPLPQSKDRIMDESSEVSSHLSKEGTVAFSNTLLKLFSMMVDLPAEYNIDQEKILGLTMHLVIALPRYFESDSTDDDQELVEEVIEIEKKHPVVAKEIKHYLESVEEMIGKGISYGERYAMYQYIIN
ncbi:BglG family transcription antiterminator [Amphibacillus sp. Q70]|uniref:BglG family transcription antiterminator n=1 Tax=Amphibacillus sp. Q70 TaxID=3453416 RepID=UPI003F83DFF9